MNGDLFACVPTENLYDVLRRDFPLMFGLKGFIKMATAKTPVSADERQQIADALLAYEAVHVRAAKAAKDRAVAAAHEAAAGRVRALAARVVSGELEI